MGRMNKFTCDPFARNLRSLLLHKGIGRQGIGAWMTEGE